MAKHTHKKYIKRSSSQSQSALQKSHAKAKEVLESSILKSGGKPNKDLDISRSKNGSRQSNKGDDFFYNRKKSSALGNRGTSAKGPRPPRNDA